MTLREEFEKAFWKTWGTKQFHDSDKPIDIALWAAKWMLEKVTDLWQEGKFTTDELVKMHKELE